MSGKNFVDLAVAVPELVLDIRYATTNNFMKEKVYAAPRCLLRKATAEKLRAAASAFAEQGLGVKVYDGYRPLSVQKKLWAICPDDRYVADPRIGSKHNRGAAVDLTLIDKEGRELVMPTAFDHLGHEAHRDYMDLPEEALKNRALLEEGMHAAGFIGLPTEWWHFDDTDWESFPLEDFCVLAL